MVEGIPAFFAASLRHSPYHRDIGPLCTQHDCHLRTALRLLDCRTPARAARRVRALWRGVERCLHRTRRRSVLDLAGALNEFGLAILVSLAPAVRRRLGDSCYVAGFGDVGHQARKESLHHVSHSRRGVGTLSRRARYGVGSRTRRKPSGDQRDAVLTRQSLSNFTSTLIAQAKALYIVV